MAPRQIRTEAEKQRVDHVIDDWFTHKPAVSDADLDTVDFGDATESSAATEDTGDALP